jgi:hypothetical protein
MKSVCRTVASCFLLVAIFFLSGCSPGSKPPVENNGKAKGNSARIEAAPNPVPAGDGLGTTTLQWDTGDGSWGQIYIAPDGGAETRMFAQGAKGSKEANWIKTGRTYEFRLYAGKERQVLLGKVKITRAKK